MQRSVRVDDVRTPQQTIALRLVHAYDLGGPPDADADGWQLLVGTRMTMGRETETGMRRGNVHGRVLLRRLTDVSSGSGVRTHRLNPKQDDFVRSAARFGFYVGGLGAGKTYASALRAILRSSPRAIRKPEVGRSPQGIRSYFCLGEFSLAGTAS